MGKYDLKEIVEYIEEMFRSDLERVKFPSLRELGAKLECSYSIFQPRWQEILAVALLSDDPRVRAAAQQRRERPYQKRAPFDPMKAVENICSRFAADPGLAVLPSHQEVAKALNFDLSQCSKGWGKVLERLRDLDDARIAACVREDRQPQSMQRGFDFGIVVVYVETLFAQNPEREDLPAQREISRLLNMHHDHVRYYWQDLLVMLSRSNNATIAALASEQIRLRRDLGNRRQQERTSRPSGAARPKIETAKLAPALTPNTEFDLARGVDYVLQCFEDNPGRIDLPPQKGIAKAMGISEQRYVKHREFFWRALAAISDPRIQTAVKRAQGLKAETIVDAVCASIEGLFQTGQDRERLPTQREIAARVSMNNSDVNKEWSRIIEQLCNSQNSRVRDAVLVWQAQSDAIVPFDLRQTITCILTLFAQNPQRKRLPSCPELEHLTGIKKGTILAHWEEIIDSLRGGDYASEMQINAALDFYAKRRPFNLRQTVAYIQGLIAQDPNCTTLPFQHEVASHFQLAQTGISLHWQEVIDELLGSSDLRIRVAAQAWIAKKQSRGSFDIGKAADYIARLFEKDKERETLPSFAEVAQFMDVPEYITRYYWTALLEHLTTYRVMRINSAIYSWYETFRRRARFDLESAKSFVHQEFRQNLERTKLPTQAEVATHLGFTAPCVVDHWPELLAALEAEGNPRIKQAISSWRQWRAKTLHFDPQDLVRRAAEFILGLFAREAGRTALPFQKEIAQAVGLKQTTISRHYMEILTALTEYEQPRVGQAVMTWLLEQFKSLDEYFPARLITHYLRALFAIELERTQLPAQAEIARALKVKPPGVRYRLHRALVPLLDSKAERLQVATLNYREQLLIKSQFDLERAQKYIAELFSHDGLRPTLPPPGEIARTLGIAQSKAELCWEFFLEYLLEDGADPRIQRAVSCWRREEAKKEQPFPVIKAVRFILEWFAADPTRDGLPLRGEIGAALNLLPQMVDWNWAKIKRSLLRSSDPRVRKAVLAGRTQTYYRVDTPLETVKIMEESGDLELDPEQLVTGAEEMEWDELAEGIAAAVKSLPSEQQEIARAILEGLAEDQDLTEVCQELEITLAEASAVMGMLREDPALQDLAEAWEI